MILILFSLIASLIGVIEDYTVVRKSLGIVRHSLGNTYPTDFAAGILYLEFDYVFIKKKWRKINSLILTIIDYSVYKLTDSNTILIGGLTLAVALCFVPNSHDHSVQTSSENKSIFNLISSLSFPFCAIVSFVIIRLYQSGNSLLRALDIIINYRIGFSSKALKQYGVSLFGTNISFTGGGWNTDKSKAYYYVDNGYVYIVMLRILYL